MRGLHNAFAITIVFAQYVFLLSVFDPGLVVKAEGLLKKNMNR